MVWIDYEVKGIATMRSTMKRIEVGNTAIEKKKRQEAREKRSSSSAIAAAMRLVGANEIGEIAKSPGSGKKRARKS